MDALGIMIHTSPSFVPAYTFMQTLVSSIFRGVVAGATRGVMTSKRGNKNFYKGKTGGL